MKHLKGYVWNIWFFSKHTIRYADSDSSSDFLQEMLSLRTCELKKMLW